MRTDRTVARTDDVTGKPQGLSRSQRGIIYALALVALGLVLGAWHLLLTGISDDFGSGIVVGALIASGMLGLLVKSVRDLR